MTIAKNKTITAQVFEIITLQRLLSQAGLGCSVTGELDESTKKAVELHKININDSDIPHEDKLPINQEYTSSYAEFVVDEAENAGLLNYKDLLESAEFLGIKPALMQALFSVYVNRDYLSCKEVNTYNEDMARARRAFDYQRFLNLVEIRRGIVRRAEIQKHIEFYLAKDKRLNPVLFTRAECYVLDEEVSCLALTGGMFKRSVCDWGVLDYSNCYDMAHAYLLDEGAQLLDFCKEIRKNHAMYKALLGLDFNTFTKLFKKAEQSPGTHLANTFLGCF